MSAIAQLGEQFVTRWLIAQEWTILQQNWRCRWGEIDIIAQSVNLPVLAFVEVKTRRYRNWDAGGALAVDAQKQRKINHTAAIFLEQYPQFFEFPCRFDVALVTYQKTAAFAQQEETQAIFLGHPVLWQGYQFTLVNYLEDAFDSIDLLNSEY